MSNERVARERLDQLLVQRGLVESREQARKLIMAAKVFVDGHPQTKAGHRFPSDVALELKAAPRFVGRGGEKLEAAFEAFDLDVEGRLCLDVGASTGGFTDCMLQHGARHVIAVDVGTNQLHWRLRSDSRVTSMEKVNARYLTCSHVDGRPSFATFDVSFISLTLVMPPVIQLLDADAEIVTLIKPQFEAGREQVDRGGVVRDAAVHQEVIENIRSFGVTELGLQWAGLCESPLKGPAGNTEFLACWKWHQEEGLTV